MRVMTLRVPGMDCRRTVRLLTARLRDVAGVESIQADPESSELLVRGEMSEESVRRTLTEAGFPPAPVDSTDR